jgi:hypothetical protein
MYNTEKANCREKETKETESGTRKQNMTEFDEFDVPVCRFGPGGDYVSDWPGAKTQLPAREPNPLGKVLAMIADVMGTTVSGELMIQDPAPLYIEGPTENHLLSQKQSGAPNKPDHTSNAPSTAGSKGDSPPAAEPMLFADDSRSSRDAKHKPHHRIRAYRRTPRKRTPRPIEGQGTLFEVNGASQSAA